MPSQLTENVLVVKQKIFPGKIDIFLIFAQNIDCGFSLHRHFRYMHEFEEGLRQYEVACLNLTVKKEHNES